MNTVQLSNWAVHEILGLTLTLSVAHEAFYVKTNEATDGRSVFVE